MKRIVSLVLITFLLLMTVSGCGQSVSKSDQKTEVKAPEVKAPEVKVPGVTADTVTVGGILDMTGSLAATLSPYKQAIIDYFRMTNDNGGVNGRKIVPKWEDDQWKAEKALAAFRKLQDEGIFAIVGQSGSTQFAALDPEIRETKTPVVGPGQSTKMQADNPYTFNVMMAYSDMGKVMVNRIVELYKGSGKAKIAYFGNTGASSKEFGEAIKAQAQALGASVVLDEAIPLDTKELSAQITKQKQSGANFNISLSTVDLITTYLRDAARLDASDIPIISGYSTLDPVIFETVGPQASKNMSAIHPFTPYYGDGPGLLELRNAAEKYKTDPKLLASLNYVHGWMSAKIFTEALKRAGRNVTRENFITAMESIKDFDTGGISGPVSYGPGQHNGMSAARFYSYDFTKKQIVPISDWYKAK